MRRSTTNTSGTKTRSSIFGESFDFGASFAWGSTAFGAHGHDDSFSDHHRSSSELPKVMEEGGEDPSSKEDEEDIYTLEIRDSTLPHTQEVQGNRRNVWKALGWTVGLVGLMLAASLVTVGLGYWTNTSNTKIITTNNNHNGEWQTVNQTTTTTTTRGDALLNSYVQSMYQLNQLQIDAMYASLQSLTQSMTQYAQWTLDQQQSAAWPFVTVPSFEMLGFHTLQSNPHVELLAFSPIVPAGLVSAWEAYSVGHETWLRDSWKLHTTLDPTDETPGWVHTNNNDDDNGNNFISPTIYQPGTVSLLGTGPFAPIWQMSPPPRDPALINLDVLSLAGMNRLYQDLLLDNHRPVVSSVQVLDGTSTTTTTTTLADTSPFDSEFKLPTPPRSVLLMPVYERLESYNTHDASSNNSKDMVGLVQVMINWEAYMDNLLPPDFVGYLVLKNTCGQAFTFRIQQPNGAGRDGKTMIAFVEERDITDQEQGSNAKHVMDDILGVGRGGVSDDDDGSCVYTLSVVPDQHFQATEGTTEQVLVQQNLRGPAPTVTKAADVHQDQNISTEPMDPMMLLVDLLLLGIPFMLALIAFCSLRKALKRYNESVEERNELLVRTAAKANGIVSGLFPTNFRDRLFGSMTPESQQESAPSSKKKEASKRNLSTTADRRAQSERMIDAMIIQEVSDEEEDEDEEDVQDTQEIFNEKSMDFVEENAALATSGSRSDGRPSLQKAQGLGRSARLRQFLNSGMNEQSDVESAPIADLFLECTVLFADISGFTAWSSVREPGQVFTLLETLYKAFDDIAKKYKVFKVETIGDCYVAVTGLPEPQKDHAVIMTRFARDCLYKAYELTKKLELTLGPDTGDLTMRFGMHSGPVTAGILRGERSRFQLFGDTVNTAARMESNGQKGRIQMSDDTARILIEAGKSRLLRKREDTITAKGKGEMVTYWLALGADNDDAVESSSGGLQPSSSFGEMSVGLGDAIDSNSVSSRGSRGGDFVRQAPAVSMSGLFRLKGGHRGPSDTKKDRLIDWSVDVLSRLLKQVIARRGKDKTIDKELEGIQWQRPEGQTVLEEVVEIITLPQFDAEAVTLQEDTKSIELSSVVLKQLREYVKGLADMYRANSFHNWEHASHVTMSIGKLLSRIVAPKSSDKHSNDALHDHTYGITSDPLTQFAVVMAGLIHDVDHTGVPNSTLVKEDAKVASHYKGKSVAEQNSVDLSWDLFMKPQFQELRDCIYTTESELIRFRSLLVNMVMATDIVDKDLKALRNARWEKAFRGTKPTTEQEITDDVNRKATIVLEHLIQASDISHTMQHWHVYRKWNERLFQEMYTAYRAGRAEKDPSEFWYKGEIGFFDFYIIPLTKKLKDCGVFGVSSDEYLNWAMKNRAEWEKRGAAVTAELVANAREKEYAKLEKMAAARAPLIAEIKDAVRAMRQETKQRKQQQRNSRRGSAQFRQASFRHLQVSYDSDDDSDSDHAAADISQNRRRTLPSSGGLTRGGLVSLSGSSAHSSMASSTHSRLDRATMKQKRMAARVNSYGDGGAKPAARPLRTGSGSSMKKPERPSTTKPTTINRAENVAPKDELPTSSTTPTTTTLNLKDTAPKSPSQFRAPSFKKPMRRASVELPTTDNNLDEEEDVSLSESE